MRNTNKKDIGLLLLRVTIGLCMFAFHGLAKISGGPEVWTKIGQAMGHLGITFIPVVWGFLAALIESIGSILLILGLWTRLSTGLLAATMLVAVLSHISQGHQWSAASHALELMAVYVSIALIGPGRYSVDKK